MSVVLAATFGVGWQGFDTVGKPLNGGQLFTYAAGTASQIPTYTTNLGTVSNANPIILGTDGRPPQEIWLTQGTSYKFELQDSLGTVIADYDNINTSVYQTTSTVTSAATGADIWSPLGPVSWTGTAVATSFAAAPNAGASKLLICNNVCAFKTSANMLIDGVASGTTIYMNNGARVNVLALTTTQFQLTYTLSGTFTATGGGFTVSPTYTLFYNVNNGVVNIDSEATSFGGTSNSSGTVLNGFISAVAPSSNRTFDPLLAINDATYVATCHGVLDSTGVLTFYKDPSGAAFTTTTTKTIYSTHFSYQL